MELEFKEPPRIANRSDALELLDGMIRHIEKSNGEAAAPFRGAKATYKKYDKRIF